uniref:Uncharacterized protein n=1 Tax=Parascaris univalens TaxID=6257 RepID=A0A915A337_PARUN
MCWKKKQDGKSHKKEPSLGQPTPQQQLGCDVACHADSTPEGRAPIDQRAAFVRRNVGNATRDSREKEEKPRKMMSTANSENPKEERKTQSHAARASNCNKHRRLTATVKTSLMRVLWLAFQRRCPFFKMKMIQIVSFRYWKKRKRARNRSEMTHAVPTTSPVATPWRVFQELCLTFRMTESFP